MNLAIEWLLDHIDPAPHAYKTSEATNRDWRNIDAEKLSETLTRIGLEVESVTDNTTRFAAFTTARVLEATQHPNAERLRICRVAVGTEDTFEEIQVVCGAPNARTGMIGVFAPSGTHIPGTGIDLKPTTIRGIDSSGMLCSERELLISDDHDGIIDLPDTTPLGVNYASHAGLDDIVLELGITPNRGDCFSVRGIARDLAAAGWGELRAMPDIDPQCTGDRSAETALEAYPAALLETVANATAPSPITWKIAPDTPCMRVYGCTLAEVTNAPSPAWLQRRLRAIGQQPISALVDVTNYITFDLGRPLHVFDADRIQASGGSTLTIHPAPAAGMTFNALDNKTYAIPAGQMVISDASAAATGATQSLAGVMGGTDTSCTLDTRRVFIEAALFSSTAVARAGRHHGIHSAARHRFERGVDSQSLEWGMRRAAAMILSLCGGTVSMITTADGDTPPPLSTPVSIDVALFHKHCGMRVEAAQATAILNQLGFHTAGDATVLTVTPPTWRHDVSSPACIVEEVLRILGYDHTPIVTDPLAGAAEADLPALRAMLAGVSTKPASKPSKKAKTATPATPPTPPTIDHALPALLRAKRALAGEVEVPALETVTNTFTSSAVIRSIGLVDPAELIPVANPISTSLDVMRPSLLINLTEQVARNLRAGHESASLFEVGPVFRADAPQLPHTHIAIVRGGLATSKHWNKAEQPFSPFDILADLRAALTALGAPTDNVRVDQTTVPKGFHPTRAASLRIGKFVIGAFGSLHPDWAQTLDVKIRKSAFALEAGYIDVDALPKLGTGQNHRTTTALEKIDPSSTVTRHFTFHIPTDKPADDLRRELLRVDKKRILHVSVLDLLALQDARALTFGVVYALAAEEDATKVYQAIEELIVQAAERWGAVFPRAS